MTVNVQTFKDYIMVFPTLGKDSKGRLVPTPFS